MAAISLTYDIVANTEVQALPLQTNFQELENYINGSVIRADGVVGMDPGTQLLLAGDATSDLAAATKQQVDAMLPLTGGTVSGGSTFSADLRVEGTTTVGATGKYLRIKDPGDSSHYVQFSTENLTSHRTWTFPNASGTVASESYVDGRTWNGNDITAGTVAFARLPTGTSSSTVAIGNHTHSYAASSHNHSGSNITSGTVAFARLPTGTGSSNVAVGNHTHSYAASSHSHSYASTSHTHSYLPLTGGTVSGTNTFTGNVNVYGSLTMTGATKVPAGNTSSCSVQAVGDSNTGIIFPAANEIQLICGGSAKLGLTTTGFYAQEIYDNTTANAANVHVFNNGLVARGGVSSRKYKTNVRPLSLGEAKKLLDMEAVVYNSTASMDDPSKEWVGRIAEQAATVDDRYVQYDEAGEVESYDYQREVAGIGVMLKDLYELVADLDRRVSTVK